MRHARVEAFIGLGANLGNAEQTLRDAAQAIGELPETRVIRRSSLYRTAPQQATGPDFVNAVLCVDTALAAPTLLDGLQMLENRFGRERPYRNAPRTLDLDLLLYGGGRILSPRLSIPHPRMAQRAFVLVPLAEIAPDRVSPAQWQASWDQRVEKIGTF